MWDISSGRPLRHLVGHSAELIHGAFSPDGTRVLTSGADETVRIWDVATGSELQVLPGGDDAYFRTDGQAVYARSPDRGSIIEWSIWVATMTGFLRSMHSLMMLF